MTPSEVLVPGAIAIVFVVGWFVFGLIDATRRDSNREDAPPGVGSIRRTLPQPARHTARTHHR
ncbi:hypothetical protein [Intrasporangium sp. YIM S08009]|uniref:hypothetical protein n=1 Tax=Intrasporangium zincisolvens TaxID=3080018 RepID=UPI002B05C6D8|nr:hypothetical protein [Intrasporangium sp. YIM S08009]